MLGCACLIPASIAPAQVTYGTAIPNEVRISPNPMTPGQITLISNFLEAEIANLKSGKLENEKAARKALKDSASSVGDTPASATYLAAYAGLFDQKLVQLQRQNPPLAVRLNAAIAMADVAAKANNGQLKNAAIGFILDKSEPVALWGVKAAKNIVPSLLEAGQAGPLATAIVDDIAFFKHDAAIVEDAYEDFTSELVAPPQIPRTLAVIDPLAKLMEMRAALYAQAQAAPAVGDGPDLPAEPQADNRGFSFIAKADVWKSVKPSQQQIMCRGGIDLLSQIIPLVDTTPGRVLNVDPPELLRKEDLLAVINHAGEAFKVIGSLTTEGAGGSIATAADGLLTAKVNAQTPSAVIKDQLSLLEKALTDANLMAPPRPLPTIPTRPAAPVPTPPTTAPSRARTLPASRPAAPTPTASGAPIR